MPVRHPSECPVKFRAQETEKGVEKTAERSHAFMLYITPRLSDMKLGFDDGQQHGSRFAEMRNGKSHLLMRALETRCPFGAMFFTGAVGRNSAATQKIVNHLHFRNVWVVFTMLAQLD